MYKNTFDQLIETGQELSEKQAQARESYDELMKKLNERLKSITVEGPTLYYTVHEWDERIYGGTLKHRKAQLALHFWEEGAYLELEEMWEDECYQWQTDTLIHPSLEVMLSVSENLDKALDYFLEKMQQWGTDHDQAVAVLAELAAKLQ
ncbi:hypothetical protein M1N44_02400 [Dehalococcoidia bacterium]|nr:hypothetical protein [Dehalococcoidia bacterium]